MMSRDELWPKHPLNEDGISTPRSLEELYLEEVESFLNEDSNEFDLFFSNLKSADDVALPESGVYFEALEARIMGALDHAIENGDVQNHTPVKSAKVENINPVVAKRAATKYAAAIRAGQTVMFVAVAVLATGKWLIAPSPSKPVSESLFARREAGAGLRAQNARAILRATHAAAPKVLTGTVMSHESKDDLTLEIAARRFVAYHKSK